MSPGWSISTVAPGVVRVRFRGGEAAAAGAELSRGLAGRERRVLLIEDLHDWPRAQTPGAVLLDERAPVVAAVRGEIPAYALSALLAADIRVGADSFATAFADGGEVITDGAVLGALSAAVGSGTAGYWVLTRRRVEAAEALRAGLVEDLVPGRELAATALAAAERVAEGAPLALEYAKEAIRRGARRRLDEALALEADLYSILQTTGDRQEGVDAFLERRAPDFRGT